MGARDFVNPSRALSWLLRIGTWCLVATPLLRWAIYPNRVWIEGRAGQFVTTGERLKATQAIINDWGLQRRYQGKLITLDLPQSRYVLSPRLMSIVWVWLSVEDRSGEEPARETGDIILEPDGRPLMPPFWGLAQDGWGSDYEPCGGAMYVRDRSGAAHRAMIGRTTGLLPRHHWLIWVHQGGRWVNALHFDTRSDSEHVVWNATPSNDDMSGVHVSNVDEAWLQKPAATFHWIPRDCTFVIELGHDPEVHVLPALNDLTFEPKAAAIPRVIDDTPPDSDEFVP